MMYEYFYEFLALELRTRHLLYVINSNEFAPENLSQRSKQENIYKVRNIIIINRIDLIYSTKILKIKDPVEILNKLKKV